MAGEVKTTSHTLPHLNQETMKTCHVDRNVSPLGFQLQQRPILVRMLAEQNLYFPDFFSRVQAALFSKFVVFNWN